MRRRLLALAGLAAASAVTHGATAPLSLTSVQFTPSCPSLGASATITAGATGGQAPLEYRFWIRNDTAGTWTIVQEYGTAASASWTPSTPGRYYAQVWARSAGSTAAWEAWLNSAPCVIGASTPLAVTGVTPSTTSGLVQRPVLWSVSTSGGVPPLEYRFWLRNQSTGAWTLLQEYGPAASVSWTPSAAGSYLVQVWARSSGSTAAYDAWANGPVVTIYPLPVVAGVVSVPPAPFGVGSAVTWSALASGGIPPLQYQFWLHDETSGAWTLLGGYGPSNAATWTPRAAGTYSVQAWVRSAGSTAAWEAWNTSGIVQAISSPLTVSSVTISPAGPLPLGVPATWTASASGGSGPLEYKFWLRNDSTGTWTVLREYAASNSVSWTPVTAGRYYAQAWVRTAGSTAAFDAAGTSAFVTAAAGPPAPVWTVAVTGTAGQTVMWGVDGVSTSYRVYRATTREALTGRLPAGPWIQATQPPVAVTVADDTVPQYYRVFGVAAGAVGEGGPIAVSTSVRTYDTQLAPIDATTGRLPTVSTSLWDVDGDGCLDLLGAAGLCTGQFDPYSLVAAGVGGLFTTGRVNRDSRFADLNGDGVVDVFTNVYSNATDAASRAMLHLGASGGGFIQDPAVDALGVGGFGETVLAADFDNDGDLDLFLPHYSHRGDGGHNWLLINDGSGRFTDVSATAGIASNLPYIPEGAQAIDFNQDGWIDIAVSSHLFINNGNRTFTDRAAAIRVPPLFDEGLKFFDADLDGDFDLAHYDAYVLRLYRNLGGALDNGTAIDGSKADTTSFGYGLNVCDINGDGFEDLVIARNDGRTGSPRLYLNAGGTLKRSVLRTTGTAYNDLLTCADLDWSGLPDIISRFSNSNSAFRTFLTRAGSPDVIRLRVVGAVGERNQQGRVVRIRPAAVPGKTLLRVIEAGSGYMAQGDYDLLVGAPWSGTYEVSVRFGSGWFTTTARQGDALTIYANGRVARTPPPPAKVTAVRGLPAPAAVGEAVTWTADARNGIAPLEYRFWMQHPNGAWTVLQDYGPLSTATWTPSVPGTYLVQVWVRSAGSTAAWETWRNSDPLLVVAP